MVKGILVNRKADDILKSQQLKMEHADLIAEMNTIENLPTHERLQLARLRRAQQLKVARQKEKEWLKSQRNRNLHASLKSTDTTYQFRNTNTPVERNGSGSSGANVGSGLTHASNFKRHISFESSVVLLEAASRNDMEEVGALLARGITPDAANEDGLTALHQCCIDNNIEMLKLLLQYGAYVDSQDSDKWTPLHAAATCGHLELVRVLIDHGANLLAVNTDGNMPYDLCDNEDTLDYIEAEMSKRGITQELIDDTRSATEYQMLKELMSLAQTGGDLEQVDDQGATPLHIAAANGYIRVVEFLLEMHVSVDAVDRDLWTPVHAAACWGHLEVLEMLAQCGADLNAKNKDGETPSNICEDPDIRKHIEQLKTEQESKRMAEAQRRRVRRSQSNNTRAQSVRRTSLRDKTLTTKKDAVEEARLRLQAQEDIITNTSAAGIRSGESHNSADIDSSSSKYVTASIQQHKQIMVVDSCSAVRPTANTIYTTVAPVIGNKHTLSWLTKETLNYTNNVEINTNNTMKAKHDEEEVANDLLTSPTKNARTEAQTSYLSMRRSPEGSEDDFYNNCINNTMEEEAVAGSAITTAAKANLTFEPGTAAATGESMQVQSSNDQTNGKINVQVTVLVDTTTTHHNHLQQQTSIPIASYNHHHQATLFTTPQYSQQRPQHQQSYPFAIVTLANLKKQRSLSRTSTATTTTIAQKIFNCDFFNGTSIIGTPSQPPTSTTASLSSMAIEKDPLNISANTKSNNSNNNEARGIGTVANSNCPTVTAATPPITTTVTSFSRVNKFTGVAGDIVSDTTSNKRCCTIM